MDRFRECITSDNGGEGVGGGGVNELKLWGIGSTRGQVPTIVVRVFNVQLGAAQTQAMISTYCITIIQQPAG